MWRSMDSGPGSLAAAPSPITARPAITIARAGVPEVMITESPDISAPAMKMPMPASMTFLRPNWSPIVPKISMVLAKVSAYAPTTHCSDETPAFSCVWIPASATLTIVMSRKVRNKTRHSVASAAERRFSLTMPCSARGRRTGLVTWPSEAAAPAAGRPAAPSACSGAALPIGSSLKQAPPGRTSHSGNWLEAVRSGHWVVNDQITLRPRRLTLPGYLPLAGGRQTGSRAGILQFQQAAEADEPDFPDAVLIDGHAVLVRERGLAAEEDRVDDRCLVRARQRDAGDLRGGRGRERQFCLRLEHLGERLPVLKQGDAARGWGLRVEERGPVRLDRRDRAGAGGRLARAAARRGRGRRRGRCGRAGVARAAAAAAACGQREADGREQAGGHYGRFADMPTLHGNSVPHKGGRES